MKCHVTIEHKGEKKTYSSRKGLGFQALAAKNQTPIEFDCRKSDCGICILRIKEGGASLSPKTKAEEDFLQAMNADKDERLACQANIWGDIVVEVEGMDFVTPQGVTLTEVAAKQAKQLQQDHQNFNGLPLRLYLDGKGCDGFSYGVTFDPQDKRDLKFEQHGVDLVVDPDTLQFTDGSIIDWVDDDRGQGFLVENPNQNSFRGKFFKQDAWKKQLYRNKKP